ncbi:MAG: hypothetical protein ABIK15_20410 [Pseudomonadota bacterium]
MEDQFVWWHGGGDYTVLDGSRKGLDRRKSMERRESVTRGIFAVNVRDRRHCFERRQIGDRRMKDRTFSIEQLTHWEISTALGVFLWITGVLFLVLGVAISQVIGMALGLLLFMGGAFVILIHFYQRRKNEDKP